MLTVSSLSTESLTVEILAKTATKHSFGDIYIYMYAITSCHVERNMEFPGENSSAKPVYITAIKWKCATAQDVQYYAEALFNTHMHTNT